MPIEEYYDRAEEYELGRDNLRNYNCTDYNKMAYRYQ